MKKRKRNQKRYLQSEKSKCQKDVLLYPPDPLVAHVREVVSMIEGRQISMEEASMLVEAVKAERAERETTPP